MFSKDILDAAIAAAKENDIPPSAMLAVIECETNGDPYEKDGNTPKFLFERHKFYSELQKRRPEKLKKAIAAGLAIPNWNKKTQYSDMKTSKAKIAVLERARAIDEECANRACSWGLGQIMGFHAEKLGFGSATEMVRFLTAGRAKASILLMIRFIRVSNLDRALRAKNFASFALGYNGKEYRKNNYDGRMIAAEKRWDRQLARGEVEPALSVEEVKAVQTQLKNAGFPVGKIDGKWGSLTTGAVAAFQRREGLKVTGTLNEETRAELREIQPLEVSEARSEEGADELRAQGSKTIASADTGGWWAKGLLALGVGGGTKETGILDQAEAVVGKVESAKSVVESAKGIVEAVAPYWWVGALIAGFFMWRAYGDIITERVRAHVSGENLSR